VKVYSGTGSLKRTWSLGWKPAGKYAVPWNGRTAAGTALPAGKYRVVASFKDARSNVRSITGYTTISWRKAVWKSVTLVKDGDAGLYAIADGGAVYYSGDYAHGVILDSGGMIRDCVGCGWAAGKFVFTVKSTSVLDYRYLYVEVRDLAREPDHPRPRSSDGQLHVRRARHDVWDPDEQVLHLADPPDHRPRRDDPGVGRRV
jgi:hypothetical protein